MRWDPINRQFRVYDKGGGSPSSTTTVNQLFSPEEAARRAKVMEEAERLYGTTAGTISNAPYPGATPVGPSPDTLAAQNFLRGYSLGPGAGLGGQALSATQFGLSDVLYPEANPALRATQAAAIRPVTEAYTDPGGVFSNIRAGAINAGQFGGSRQGIAEGVAGGRYLSTIGDISAKIASEGYERGLGTFERTLAMAPQTFALGAQPAVGLSAVGAQGEAYQQTQEDYNAASRMWALNAPWMPLQNYANIVYGGIQAGTRTDTAGSAPQVNKPMTALGGAAAGAYVGSQIYPGWGTVIGAGVGALAAWLGTS